MAIKSIAGEWLTPTPITIKVDEEAEAEDGLFKFVTERGHMKIVVRKNVTKVDGSEKVQRLVTLTELGTEGREEFVCKGRANMKVNRITFESGATWCRPGATLRDKENANNNNKKFEADGVHEAPDDAAGGGGCLCFRSGGAPEPAPDAPQPVPENDAPDDDADPPIREGFLSDDQVDDVVDRINEVIGIWGISEEKEAEFIKPPVVEMNKRIRDCLKDMMDNQLVVLLGALMDDDVSPGKKSLLTSRYIRQTFVNPLTAKLMDQMSDKFHLPSFMSDQMEKMVKLVSEQVSDEVMSKAIEQLNDVEDC
jgi:hypothetical protein